MKKKVLLYNISKDEYASLHDQLSSSYDIVNTTQFFDLKNIFKSNEISAVLASSKSGVNTHQLFKEHYSQYSCVFLDERSKDSDSQTHIRFLNPSSKDEEIIKALNKVISQGERNRKQVVYEEVSKILEKLNQVQGLEIDEYMEQSLDILGKYLKAENVIWIASDKINYYLHEMWKVQTLNGHLQSRGRGEEQKTIHSLRGATPNDLSKSLQSFTNIVGSDWAKEEKIKYANNMLMIPVIKSGICFGYYMVLDAQNYDCFKVHSVLMKLSSYLAVRYELAYEYTRVKKMSYIDDLTELYNQRYLSPAIEKCIDKYETHGECFSVLFMDIDHFKKVNDREGHLVGSKILIELGKILKQNIRSIDFGFRYGGDEYLLLLSNTDAETAQIVAERIRSQVESTVFNLDGVEIGITLSIGIACFPLHAKNKKDILEMADKAMYYGKNKSRNIVYMAS